MNQEVGATQSTSQPLRAAHSDTASAGYSILRLVLLALVAGAIAGGIAWAALPIFRVPSELEIPFPPEGISAQREAARLHCRLLNSVVFFGTFGFLLSAIMGGGEAAARRLSGGAAARILAGVILGTVIGCLAGAAGELLNQVLPGKEQLVPIAKTVMAQGATLALLCAAVAAAVGLASGGVAAARSNVVSGILAGILVAFLVPVLFSLALPNVDTEVAVPGAATVAKTQKHLGALVVYLGMICVTLGVLIPLGSRPRRAK